MNSSGFLNIIKPTGMSSSSVVIQVRKILKIKKVGHLGTLDPAASGVLPIAVGKYTRFFNYFLNKDKEYIAKVKFGVETDTLDSFGNITKIQDGINIKIEDIKRVLPEFIGKINQVPPRYSAIKISGKNAYELARAGIKFDIKPREIEIYNIEILKDFGDNEFLFKANVSAGTYIRTLFLDIAKKLNSTATTTVIIRTRSGNFDIENAITLDELSQNSKLIDAKEYFNKAKFIEVNDDIAKRLLNGINVLPAEIDGKLTEKQEFFAVYKENLIALYMVNNGTLEKIINLYEN